MKSIHDRIAKDNNFCVMASGEACPIKKYQLQLSASTLTFSKSTSENPNDSQMTKSDDFPYCEKGLHPSSDIGRI